MTDKFMKNLNFGGDTYYPLPKVRNSEDGLALKVINGDWGIDIDPDTCLSFIGNEEFTLKNFNLKKSWDGTLEYYTDFGWLEWDGNKISSSGGKIHFRGIGNTVITTNFGSFQFDGPNSLKIACKGNIENLLDYNIVKSGEHPSMGKYAFKNMFYNCVALTTPPELPSFELAELCYAEMFYKCVALTTLPKLPAIYVAPESYRNMFNGCSSIKLSTTQTDEYQTPYRIPSSGHVTSASYPCSYMFDNTGGTFTGTPEINTTYYTSNEVI